jgi:hypothetical protein
MVHQTDKEISAFVVQLSPGLTRDTQCENDTERVQVEHVLPKTTGGGMNTLMRAELKKGFITR